MLNLISVIQVRERDSWNSVGESQWESCNNFQGCEWQLQKTKLIPSFIKGNEVNTICVNKDAVSCTGVQAEQFGAQKSIAVVKTQQSLTHTKKPVEWMINVTFYKMITMQTSECLKIDLKLSLKCAHSVDATVACDKPEINLPSS